MFFICRDAINEVNPKSFLSNFWGSPHALRLYFYFISSYYFGNQPYNVHQRFLFVLWRLL